VGGGKVIVISDDDNEPEFASQQFPPQEAQVLGFTLLYPVPIMDLFQMMGMGGTGLISWLRGNVASCLLELWRKYNKD
jgi:hypothetical protein